VSALVLFAVGLVTAQAPAKPVLVGPPEDLRRSPVVQVVESAGPAVVNIGAEVVTAQNPFGRGGGGEDPFWQFFGGQRRAQRSQSLGSGVIIDASGLVLTNEHVVSRATDITVTLADRRTFRAEVVGADPQFDVAVLKILDARALPVVRVGSSRDLMPGEPVVAIGNPFGLSNSVTTGVVSALHRSIESEDRVYEDFIQTDAAINPGNSGGALLNILGELIGINTAIYRSGSGIGFAIPIDRATAVVQEVLRYGEVRPAYTGLLIDAESAGGARVVAVVPGSPAEQAGLQKGDLVVDLGGQEVRSGRAFWQMERGLIPGHDIRLTVARGDERRGVTLVVRELARDVATRLGAARLGLEVRAQQGRLLITRVAPRSSAAKVGVKAGDLLLALGGRRLRTAQEFEAVCAAIHDAASVLAVVGRGRVAYNVPLELATEDLPSP
jgi:serine protease Do